MDIYETIISRRTIRKFKDIEIPFELLKKCVNSARLAPSGSNLQPLEYIIVSKEKNLERIFQTLFFAGYLENGAPKENEKPKAYIIILFNKEIRPVGGESDVGFSSENIILTALSEGVSCCPIGSIKKDKLRDVLNIPKNYEISLVIALGYPKEESKVEEYSGSVKYWRDSSGIMHVPKRKLKDILHDEEKF